ncbi:MAG TPA: Ig-like domain-containing protein, partial [Acidimicrobiia bacterium]
SASATTTAVAALQSISVAPANKTLAPGMTQQYTATGTYSDNSTQDLTASSAWTSSSVGVASVSSGGLVTATAPGTTNVSASAGGTTGATGLHVSPLRLITLRPLLSIVRTGGTRALTATGRFANGVTATINDQVTWSSTNPGVAGVSPQGVVTSGAPGLTIIVARFGSSFSIPALVLVL